MPEQKDLIADVRRWYVMNGKQPVRTKGKSDEEKKLARDWNILINANLNLSDELLAQVEELLAQFDSGVDDLVAWMYEHKRYPRRSR